MHKRNLLHSPRLSELKRKKRRIFIKKILIFLFALLFLLGILSYISRRTGLNISEVKIMGNKVADTETIQQAVQKEIAGSYLWLFPKTNVLFYPENKIKDELHAQFKGLSEITLSIKDRKTLEIFLTERLGAYLWCGNTIPDEILTAATDTISKCYFVDDDGYIFDEAPYFSGEVYFKLYGLTDKATAEGTTPLGAYFKEQHFKGIISFKKILEDIGLKPVMLYAENDGSIKIFLTKGKISVTRPEIIFRTDSDFQKIAENLKAAFDTEPLKSKFKTAYSSLLYIDLRFGNKVYYKFK